MKKMILILSLLVVSCSLSTVWAMGGTPPEGQTGATSTVSTQEMKTYESKFGFSVSYPADWEIKEWPLQPRMVGQPISLFNGKGNNLEFGLYHYVNKYGKGDINEPENDQNIIRKRVKSLNLIKEIEGETLVKVGACKAYVYYGKSNRNPGAKFIVAMIYLSQIEDYLIVKEEVYQDNNFKNRLKEFTNALRWVGLTDK